MNMIFLDEAARDSGNLGFSEACPLVIVSQLSSSLTQLDSPACPDCMYVHSLRNVHDQLNIGVIIVVRTSGYLFTVALALGPPTAL